jgi:hypothetical protein
VSLTRTSAPSTSGRGPRGPRAAVSVEELRRAWVAVQAGDFRRRPTKAAQTAAEPTGSGGDQVGHPFNDGTRVWVPAPGERVLPVLGCAGSAGTTTVALAVALAAAAADVSARVVECSPVTTSGLVTASHAELGLDETGWRQGRRDQVLLERVNDMVERPTDIPTPSPAPGAGAGESLTVLDGGWDLQQLLGEPSWRRETIRTCPTVIVVASATVPGLRRLEAALELLDVDHTIAALLGPLLRKWPKAVIGSAGPRTRHLLEQGRFQAIPHDRGLGVNGLDSTPLPPRLLHAAGALLALADIGSATGAATSPGPAPERSGTTTTTTNDHFVGRTTP